MEASEFTVAPSDPLGEPDPVVEEASVESEPVVEGAPVTETPEETLPPFETPESPFPAPVIDDPEVAAEESTGDDRKPWPPEPAPAPLVTSHAPDWLTRPNQVG
jgi:hypothetical protein